MPHALSCLYPGSSLGNRASYYTQCWSVGRILEFYSRIIPSQPATLNGEGLGCIVVRNSSYHFFAVFKLKKCLSGDNYRTPSQLYFTRICRCVDVVYKLWALCTSWVLWTICRCVNLYSCYRCVQVAVYVLFARCDVVYKLWVLCTSCGCCVQAECCELFVGVLTCIAVTGVYR